MRIAFVAYGSLEQTTGGYVYDRHLVAGLRGLGKTVATFAMAPGDRRWPPGVGAFDVVLEDELIHPSLARRDPRVPRAPGPLIVSLVHNLTCLQPATAGRAQAEAAERRYLARLDAVIAVCADTLAGVRAVSGRDDLPALVAHPGADHGMIPEEATGDPLAVAGQWSGIEGRSRAPGALRALFVGTVAPHKGVHRLLAVIADLPPGSVTLDIAGRLDVAPAYVERIRQEIVGRGLGDRVWLRGELAREALGELYRHSQLLLLPSDREAYPLVALEALAFGLPLLLTSEGGTRELLDGSDAGRLLPPDDQAAWTEHLRRFAEDRALLEAASHAAMARHRRHPKWSDTVRKVQAFLTSLWLPPSP